MSSLYGLALESEELPTWLLHKLSIQWPELLSLIETLQFASICPQGHNCCHSMQAQEKQENSHSSKRHLHFPHPRLWWGVGAGRMEVIYKGRRLGSFASNMTTCWLEHDSFCHPIFCLTCMYIIGWVFSSTYLVWFTLTKGVLHNNVAILWNVNPLWQYARAVDSTAVF